MTTKTWPGGAWSFTRFGGLGAIGFAALIVGANLVLEPAGMPVVGADIEEVNTFFTTESGAVGLSSSITPAAWCCVIVFGAATVATIWPRERAAGSAWSLVGFAGLLLQTAAFVGVVAIRLALSATTERSGTAALWALHNALFVLNGVFLTVALLGLSLGGRRAGLIRRWHATVGLLAAAGLFVSATLTPVIIDHAGPLALISLISWLLWVAWLVTYGVTLLRLTPTNQPAPV
ncbi:hypothetical protein [Nocardia brasiliensis]|uniref:hypothetical protein n=1 Tax=Nocardia brasiliensis TaxID=37326 RepID=UPI0024589721|nr:hypothetical protein [Nocardia brasiliensis]